MFMVGYYLIVDID